MKNYNKSSIYKLCCNDLKIKEIYIGSTTNFTRRKQAHKQDCNNPNSKNYNLKVYKFIRDNGGWTNWSMILIDNVSCENNLELLKIEREYIEKNNSLLNCNIPCRTNKEWQIDNRELQIKKRKEYRNTHNQNEKMTCECGMEILIRSYNRHISRIKHKNLLNDKNYYTDKTKKERKKEYDLNNRCR